VFDGNVEDGGIGLDRVLVESDKGLNSSGQVEDHDDMDHLLGLDAGTVASAGLKMIAS